MFETTVTSKLVEHLPPPSPEWIYRFICSGCFLLTAAYLIRGYPGGPVAVAGRVLTWLGLHPDSQIAAVQEWTETRSAQLSGAAFWALVIIGLLYLTGSITTHGRERWPSTACVLFSVLMQTGDSLHIWLLVVFIGGIVITRYIRDMRSFDTTTALDRIFDTIFLFLFFGTILLIAPFVVSIFKPGQRRISPTEQKNPAQSQP